MLYLLCVQVNLMGGQISMVDKDGPGACFRFDLTFECHDHPYNWRNSIVQPEFLLPKLSSVEGGQVNPQTHASANWSCLQAKLPLLGHAFMLFSCPSFSGASCHAAQLCRGSHSCRLDGEKRPSCVESFPVE